MPSLGQSIYLIYFWMIPEVMKIWNLRLVASLCLLRTCFSLSLHSLKNHKVVLFSELCNNSSKLNCHLHSQKMSERFLRMQITI